MPRLLTILRAWLPRLRAAGLALALAAGLAAAPPGASDGPALEYKVKAGYLFNFAKFIEWPTEAAKPPERPFVVGVIDDGEALPILRSLLEGKQVNGRPVAVRALAIGDLDSDVQILLVTRASGKTPEEVRAALGDARTLLVGETDLFAERGGMVGFVREDDAIRLTLNLERTAEAGLKVSAKLASVARVVRAQRAK